MKRDIIVICGPTAVGKTEYAIKTALKMNGEVVSCDSMQLYKYMDIGLSLIHICTESLLMTEEKLFPLDRLRKWKTESSSSTPFQRDSPLVEQESDS